MPVLFGAEAEGVVAASLGQLPWIALGRVGRREVGGAVRFRDRLPRRAAKSLLALQPRWMWCLCADLRGWPRVRGAQWALLRRVVGAVAVAGSYAHAPCSHAWGAPSWAQLPLAA